jgi:hypothetical protein
MKTKRKLALDRETLVELKTASLDDVHGGTILPLTPVCVSNTSFKIVCVSNNGNGSCIRC